jgi:hypothetical protein
MKAHGYLFSLAQCAFGELINQRSRGSIGDPHFCTMVCRLDKFLDPKFPVMPGEKDVLKMIGVEPYQTDYEGEVAALSQQAWTKLRNQRVDGSDLSETILEEDRASWKELFARVNEIYVEAGSPPALDELDHPLLDKVLVSKDSCSAVDPPLSKRFDLRTRYFWRQFVRTKREREPYNVEAPKKANDGIDFRIYTYLALPALIVAIESGFFSSIENIKSFQTSWFKKPTTLAEMWRNGNHPAPKWP